MKMKLCRMCGDEGTVWWNPENGMYSIECDNEKCGNKTCEHTHEGDAIMEWNLQWKRVLQEPWRDAMLEVPCGDCVVLVIVSVKHKNVEMIDAYEIAEYDPEEEDWILEGWPEIEHPNVKWWMPLPEAPEEAEHE